MEQYTDLARTLEYPMHSADGLYSGAQGTNYVTTRIWSIFKSSDGVVVAKGHISRFCVVTLTGMLESSDIA